MSWVSRLTQQHCPHKFQLWNNGPNYTEYKCIKCGLMEKIPDTEWGPETLWAKQQIEKGNNH